MDKVYFDVHGNPHPFPIGKDAAKKLRSKKYIGDECPECGYKSFYTKNDKCVMCALNESTEFYAFCVGKMRFNSLGVETWTAHEHDRRFTVQKEGRDVTWGYRFETEELRALFPEVCPTSARNARMAGLEIFIRPEPCAVAGHRGIRTIDGVCYQCDRDRQVLSPRQEAIKLHNNWYTPTEPCRVCGQIAPRNVANGRCKGCQDNATESPRQAAIRAGEKWYTPTEPCPKCGQIALKRVDNGLCQGCVPPPKPSPRQAAIRAGEKWYLPLEPCKHCGQVALKRVDNGQCKGCTVDLTVQAPGLIISRNDALTLGMDTYRTGETCPDCGLAGYRYISSNKCKICVDKQVRGC